MKGRARPEDKVIISFVHYIADKFYPGLRISEWPDKKSGSSGEIDAIAKSTDNCIAIEHTSIDSLPNQRRDNARFTQVFVPLEQELCDRTDVRVCLIIPFRALPTGANWDTIRVKLRAWIDREVPMLPSGTAKHNVAGIPFPVTVRKPTGAPRLWFARFAEDDPEFVACIQNLVIAKAKKLKKYKEAGYSTVLLIENSDLANMCLSTMVEAISNAFPSSLPPEVDRIWYADTSIPDSHQFWNLSPTSRAKMVVMSATEELDNPPE